MDTISKSKPFVLGETNKVVLQGALSLGSQLLTEDVYAIYGSMRQKWPHERQVKELNDLFRVSQN